MIQITPQMKIFIAVKPIDFRNQHDGIGGIIKSILLNDPLSGAVFVFSNKRKNGIKMLFFDGQGMWLCHKRLSQGRLSWWPKSNEEATSLDARNLHILLWNGNLDKIKLGQNWKKI